MRILPRVTSPFVERKFLTNFKINLINFKQMANKKANRQLKKIKILSIVIDWGLKTFYGATSTHYKIDSVVLKMRLSILFREVYSSEKQDKSCSKIWKIYKIKKKTTFVKYIRTWNFVSLIIYCFHLMFAIVSYIILA